VIYASSFKETKTQRKTIQKLDTMPDLNLIEPIQVSSLENISFINLNTQAKFEKPHLYGVHISEKT
jgi:hypothetical protein